MNSRKIYYRELIKESIKEKVICEYCNKIIHKKYNLYLYLHVNIESFPIFHFFCNRDCKINWIYKIQKLTKDKLLELFDCGIYCLSERRQMDYDLFKTIQELLKENKIDITVKI